MMLELHNGKTVTRAIQKPVAINALTYTNLVLFFLSLVSRSFLCFSRFQSWNFFGVFRPTLFTAMYFEQVTCAFLMEQAKQWGFRDLDPPSFYLWCSWYFSWFLFFLFFFLVTRQSTNVFYSPRLLFLPFLPYVIIITTTTTTTLHNNHNIKNNVIAEHRGHLNANLFIPPRM